MILFVLSFITLAFMRGKDHLSTIRTGAKIFFTRLNCLLFSRVFRAPLINYKLFGVFVLISFSTLFGLISFSHHLILSWLCCTIFIIVLFLWIQGYIPFIRSGSSTIKLARILIVNIHIPILSLLMSFIEIITHLFRPITMFGRIWVNLWVGHLLLRVSSFGCLFIFTKMVFSELLRAFIISITVLIVLFLYEMVVAILQSLVLTYLSRLYYKENLERSK